MKIYVITNNFFPIFLNLYNRIKDKIKIKNIASPSTSYVLNSSSIEFTSLMGYIISCTIYNEVSAANKANRVKIIFLKIFFVTITFF